MVDGLEVGFDFAVELGVAVAGQVVGVGLDSDFLQPVMFKAATPSVKAAIAVSIHFVFMLFSFFGLIVVQ